MFLTIYTMINLVSFQVNTVFDYTRFIMFSRVIETGNPPRMTICIRDKEAENLLDMFQVKQFLKILKRSRPLFYL